jgi:peptidoglycan/LPS O-acetylase OafA/YrhL
MQVQGAVASLDAEDSSAARPVRRERIPQLDGLRALAIMAVFIHHALGVPLLWMGVDLFFILSGFLITGVLIKLKADGGSYFGTFYGRRARRILPPYAVFLVLASLFFPFDWHRLWYWYVFFAANLAEALHRGANGVFQPLWSLSVEEQFYLVWPVLFLLSDARRMKQLAWMGVLAAPVLRFVATPFVHSRPPFVIYFLTPFRMDLLCAGSLVALTWYADRSQVRRLKTAATWAAAAGVLIMLALSRVPSFRTGMNSALFNVLGYSLSVLIFTSILVVALSTDSGPLHRTLTAAVPRYVGRISYTMYLVHESMLMFARDLTGQRWLQTLLALAFTIGFATVSWFLIEAPLLRPRGTPTEGSYTRDPDRG